MLRETSSTVRVFMDVDNTAMAAVGPKQFFNDKLFKNLFKIFSAIA
jgi:hypothetical protein